MKNNKTIGYKAFKKGLICKGKQYKENTVYKENGNKICEAGVMHYCENPFDVLEYYPLVNGNGEIPEFAEVEPLGEVYRQEIKSATNKLRIGTKLGFADFVNTCINFTLEYTKVNESKEKFTQDAATIIISEDFAEIITSNEDATQITSNGSDARIASNGHDTKIVSSGDYAKIASNGRNAYIASSGYAAQITNNEDKAHIASNGYDAYIAGNGDSTRIVSNENNAHIASNGYDAQIASSGDYAKIASNGSDARIASSGNAAQITSNGNDARIVSSGIGAIIASSGDCSNVVSSGERSAVVSIGYNSIAKAKIGSWITLAEWENGEDNGYFIQNLKCVKTEYVDGERIKEDVFYKLENGEFVEVAQKRERKI